MAFPDKNYSLGTGKVFFGMFTPGTKTVAKGGQRYLGNTPEFNLNSESESLDHFDADNGIRVKDDSVLLELTRAGSFITDHISPANLAMWFLGTDGVVEQAVLTDVDETITNANTGVRYQLGTSPSNPSGVRGLTSVTGVVGATPLVEGTDYTVNLATGSVTFIPGGLIVVDAGTADPVMTYSAAATEYNQIITGSNAQVEGEMFFEATNTKGVRFDYLFPFVQLKPDGDFALKSNDEWQQLSFTFEALKKSDTVEVVYVNGRAGVGV